MQPPTYRCTYCSSKTTVIVHPSDEMCPAQAPQPGDRVAIRNNTDELLVHKVHPKPNHHRPCWVLDGFMNDGTFLQVVRYRDNMPDSEHHQ